VREAQGIAPLFTLMAVAPFWFISLLMLFPNSPIWVMLSLVLFTSSGSSGDTNHNSESR